MECEIYEIDQWFLVFVWSKIHGDGYIIFWIFLYEYLSN